MKIEIPIDQISIKKNNIKIRILYIKNISIININYYFLNNI
jgi:hypothetical protein